MPNDNAQLKELVHEAKDACRVKINALIQEVGEDDPGVTGLNASVKKTFDKFRIEGIWLNPIEFDQLQFVQHILAVRILPDGVFDDLKEAIEKLIRFLEEKILKAPLDALAATSTSDWNLKMLEALRQIRSTITRKKNAMAAAGNDPMDDAAFRKQDERFNNQIEVYRTKLKKNEVETDENDLRMVGLYDKLIGVVNTVPQFTGAYKLLNDFIEQKITDNPN